MRIAIPVVGDDVSPSPEACEAVKFYEDDHGRILRTFTESVEAGGTMLAIVERQGVDALVCGALEREAKRALALSGLLVASGYTGGADAAAKAYLGETVASDPNNTCHICSF